PVVDPTTGLFASCSGQVVSGGAVIHDRPCAVHPEARLRTELAAMAEKLRQAEAERDQNERSRQHWEDEALRYAQNADYWQKRAVEAERARDALAPEDGPAAVYEAEVGIAERDALRAEVSVLAETNRR